MEVRGGARESRTVGILVLFDEIVGPKHFGFDELVAGGYGGGGGGWW